MHYYPLHIGTLPHWSNSVVPINLGPFLQALLPEYYILEKFRLVLEPILSLSIAVKTSSWNGKIYLHFILLPIFSQWADSQWVSGGYLLELPNLGKIMLPKRPPRAYPINIVQNKFYAMLILSTLIG